MSTQLLSRLSPTRNRQEEHPDQGAPQEAHHGKTTGHPGTLLALRLLAALALVATSYLHVKLALDTGLDGKPVTLPQLFIGQAIAAAAAGGLLMVRDRELFWLPALAIAIGSAVPVLASVYFPLPAIGPMPPINEPVWYDEKLLSLALAASVPVLWMIRRIAPPER
jgi:hypothetical protein